MTNQGVELNVAGLDAGYGGQIIIRGVGFRLSGGEVLGVIGQNGSGKSTLAKALMGACRIFAGSVSLNGNELAGLKTRVIAAVM